MVDQKVFEDLQLVEKYFYDPFCSDDSIISHHLHQVEELLKKRGA